MPDSAKVDILIVDDLPEKVLVYRTILESLGENLVVAKSGSEALALILRGEFAVILLDVYMPEMDGMETAGLIRQRKKSAHIPIIFVTALADEARIAQGYALGAVDYILAPVNPEVLRAKVKVFVDMFRMARQVKRQAEERVALTEERTRREAAEEANRRLALRAAAPCWADCSMSSGRRPTRPGSPCPCWPMSPRWSCPCHSPMCRKTTSPGATKMA